MLKIILNEVNRLFNRKYWVDNYKFNRNHGNSQYSVIVYISSDDFTLVSK